MRIVIPWNELNFCYAMKPWLPWYGYDQTAIASISYNQEGKSISTILLKKQTRLNLHVTQPGSYLTIGCVPAFNITDMAFQPRQFRELIVRPVLKHLDPEIPYSTVAEELIDRKS